MLADVAQAAGLQEEVRGITIRCSSDPPSNTSHASSTSIRSEAASHHGKKLPWVTARSQHVGGISPESHTSFGHSSFPSGQTPRKKGPNKINDFDGFACDIVKPGMIFRGLDPRRHLKSDVQ